MDYKEIRKHHIKPFLKHLLEDWLDRFFFIVLLIFLINTAFIEFNKMSTGNEIQKMFSIVSDIAV